MGFKKQRLGPALVAAARGGQRYRDVHVFFGGTGAVGGTGLLEMIDMYEEMMSIQPAGDDDVPVLVATGVTRDEIRTFTQRLFRWTEARHGRDKLPRRVRNGYLTHSGIFVALERFKVVPLPELGAILDVPPAERRGQVGAYLATLGTRLDAPAEETVAALARAISAAHPFADFLSAYRRGPLAARGVERYRSVVLGIPLPSLIAYHLAGLEEVVKHLAGIRPEHVKHLKSTFEEAVRDDVASLEAEADHVLVAHTTAVGGMYDETNGKVTIRLGFAHSAVDQRIYEKQRAAATLTELYAKKGIKMLVTAAGIGVDEVRVRSQVPVHHQVQHMLFDAPRELFPGSKEALPPSARASREAGRPIPRRQHCRTFRPLDLAWDQPTGTDVTFERGDDLIPSYVIRSGENGYFSVANADALYRVMRVASANELGFVLARTGLLGDDPQAPWFPEAICYYTETDNSRQVFDFVSQPMLLQAQLSGLDPMTLQDLGNAKHQGELHTLGLLILLHRLRTLDIDAIPPYVDLERFDARTFFVEHSKPLLFEDLDGWTLDGLARDLRVLAAANTPEDLEPLKPFMRHGHADLYPLKQAARRQVLECVLKAVWAVPSLGCPILYADDQGATHVRYGYFCAPLDLLVTRDDALRVRLDERFARVGTGRLDDLRDHVVASAGFVDLRPQALISWATTDAEALAGKVARASTDDELRRVLAGIEPYSAFATSGLVALLFRLRALYGQLREGMIELGSLQTYAWHMPRDAAGHIQLVPGVVEAFRMVSEGFEKATGNDRLDGIWGYERRQPPDRRGSIPLGR